MPVSKVSKIVGKNLRHYRKEAKLTQEQLADEANSSSYYISCLERGLENVGVQTLEKFCKVLKIELYLLFLPIPEEKQSTKS